MISMRSGLRQAGVLALGVFGLMSHPASASSIEVFECADRERPNLSVAVTGPLQPKATVSQERTALVSLTRTDITEKAFLGGPLQTYEGEMSTGERAVFAKLGDKGVLGLENKTVFCQLVGGPQDIFFQLPSIVFDGEGFALKQPGDPEARYEFGMTTDQILAVLGRYLGTPRVKVRYGADDACPAKVVTFAPMNLYFQQDEWVGWALERDGRTRESGIRVSAPAEIRIGSPASALDTIAERYEDSSLGDERIGDGVHYVVSDAPYRKLITDVWSGYACVAR